MAAISPMQGRRAGMFSTHRGRKVRNVGLTLLLASFVSMQVNGALHPQSPAATASPASASVGMGDVDQAPQVAAPVSDAFYVAPTSAATSGVDQSTGLGASTPAVDENVPLQSAAAAAQQVAVAYATYSWQEGRAKYVSKVPFLSTQARKDLDVESSASWPQIEATRLVAVGIPQGGQPKAYSLGGGLAQADVTVAQRVQSAATSGLMSRSYRVQMRNVGSVNDPRWEVTAIN